MFRPRLITLCGPALAACLLFAPACKQTGSSNSGNSDDPPDPEVAYQEGLTLLNDGKEAGRIDYKKVYEKFRLACEQGQEFNSPHLKACYNTGVAADRVEPRAAAKYYTMALDIDPGFREAVQNRTVALQNAGKSVDALPVYESFLAKNPTDWDMVNNFAGALAEAGRYDDAVGQIHKLLFQDVKNTRAYKTLARVYFLQGNFRMSQVASSEALKITKDDADIHNNMGLAFLKLGKEAEAVVAFKEAIKLDEGNLEANMNLGLIAVKAADWALAAKSFTTVLKEQPGQVEAKVGMAIANRGNLEHDTAVEIYDDILKGDACNETALLNKAVVEYTFQGDNKRALKTYKAFQGCHPDTNIDDRIALVQTAIAEAAEMARLQAEMERQLAELEQKAKDMKPVLEKMVERGQKVFEKYAEVEQDPSWFEQLLIQVEATQFALESEDFFFMEETRTYFEEFMVSYYEYALEQPSDEWTSGEDIVVPKPEVEGEAATESSESPAEGESAPAEGESAEGEPAPAEGEATATEGEVAPTEGEAAPTEGEATPTKTVESTTEEEPEAGNSEATEGSNP